MAETEVIGPAREGDAAAPFVPPFPPRHAAPLGTFALLRTASRNLLEIWEEQSFSHDLMRTRLLTRDAWICNSPDTVRHAFLTAAQTFERKSPQMRSALRPLLGDGLFISEGATWRTRRGLVAPVIHISRLSAFAPIMLETAAEHADRWAGESDVDALSEMARLTAEVICRTLFGRALGHASAAEVVEGFSQYQASVGQTDLQTLLGLPDWLPRLQSPRVGHNVRRIRRIFDRILAEFLAAPDPRSVIGALIARADQEGASLTRDGLRNEVATLFMAGHETTANTLAWAWYLLSQAPAVESRLHAELDGVLQGRPPTLADVERLPYCRAVIEETLRLYPPVPFLAREAAGPEVLRRRAVTPGSLIIVSPWLLHRHRKHWRDPDAFIPERFLPGQPTPDKFVYLPFSVGPRICAGLAFGLTEAILCLASLAQRFELRLKPGVEVWPICRLTLRPGDRLPMAVRRRPEAPVARGEP
jgi:cytochrome P450